MSPQADMQCLVLLQYASDEAVRREAVDLDAFVDAARTHGFGMWKLDCRSDPLCCFACRENNNLTTDSKHSLSHSAALRAMEPHRDDRL